MCIKWLKRELLLLSFIYSFIERYEAGGHTFRFCSPFIFDSYLLRFSIIWSERRKIMKWDFHFLMTDHSDWKCEINLEGDIRNYCWSTIRSSSYWTNKMLRSNGFYFWKELLIHVSLFISPFYGYSLSFSQLWPYAIKSSKWAQNEVEVAMREKKPVARNVYV